MGKKFLNFLKKYWFCILLSVIMVMGNVFATYYSDLCTFGGDAFRAGLDTIYQFIITPIYSLIYGCLSYIKLKKIWTPQLILYIVAFLYWFRFDITELTWLGTYIWSVYPTIFSLIGVGITVFIRRLIKVIQQSGNGF